MRGPAARETAGVTTRLIVSYVRRHHGDDGVRQLLELAGDDRPVELLEDELGWSTYDQKIALFEAAAQVTGDEQVARRIGGSLLDQQLAAPLKLVIGALGSPQQVLRSCARANARFSTTATMDALEATRGRAVVTYRLHDGYEPSHHDCRYTQGVLTQASALFGLPPATVVHDACQVEGAPACRYEVTWKRLRWYHRLGRAPRRTRSSDVEVLESRIADLEATVADLVSPRGLDDVLARIAERAGAAVRGQRFLLVVELDGEARPRVVSDGIDAHVADDLATELLLRGPGAGRGQQERLVAEVASARRRYGYLAVYVPSGTGFLPSEQSQLDAFGRLAAAALDSATAVADARRGEATARAILALAHDLAHLDDEVTAAQRIVEAVLPVVGCDRATLLLVEGDKPRIAADQGWPEDLRSLVRAAVVDPTAAAALRELRAAPEPRIYAADHHDVALRHIMRQFDAAALAVAPIVVRDEFFGLVVGAWSTGVGTPAHEATAMRGLAGLADHAGVAFAGLRLLRHARHQADHDPLTGLANRSLFDAELTRALADRRGASHAVVCFLDLDGFKAVNDAFGHAAGDRVLVEVASRLRSAVRERDVVARISGDEFGVLLRDLGAPHDAIRVADSLISAIAEPFAVDGGTVRIGVSIGVADVPPQGASPSQLLRMADAAMYAAKAQGGRSCVRYDTAATVTD